MKQLISILSILLSLNFYSCSDDKLPTETVAENSEKCSVTFSISKSADSEFSVVTRGTGTTVTDDYTVRFYLFKKRGVNEVTNENKYILVQTEEVTSPLYTIEGLDTDSVYKYLFVAALKEHADALEAWDFSTVTAGSGMGEGISYPTKKASVEIKSLLGNCFIDYFTQLMPNADGVITVNVNRDFAIYGHGAEFYPGQNYFTPLDVLMEKQFGIVEFKYTDAQAGDKLTCSFSSDYYRLYLSQMFKDENGKYTSENKAIFQNTVVDMSDPINEHKIGDYFSVSDLLISGNGSLPVFSKEKTLVEGENSIQIFMPYTSAETAGNNTNELFQANYIVSKLDGMEGTQGPSGDITLKIERNGSEPLIYGIKNRSFPIYRNVKTIFTTVGDNYLEMHLGTENGGVELDDDKWNGYN